MQLLVRDIDWLLVDTCVCVKVDEAVRLCVRVPEIVVERVGETLGDADAASLPTVKSTPQACSDGSNGEGRSGTDVSIVASSCLWHQQVDLV